MAKTLYVEEIEQEDQLASHITRNYEEWQSYRAGLIDEWRQVQEYVFATDTRRTRNSQLPWSNKTTVPKMCQIRDNLHANYMASLFPKRKFVQWEGSTEDDETPQKREAIESYMLWAIDRNEHYSTASKLAYDYIDTGNIFATVEWVDNRDVNREDGDLTGQYVGPMLRRISPYDIVFNPLAPSFEESPKIISSIITLGECKDLMERISVTEEDREIAKATWDKMRKLRHVASSTKRGEISRKNSSYTIGGFSSISNYLTSDSVELLTFYGDIYDGHNDIFMKNMVIVVVDRMFVLYKKKNNTATGRPHIFHATWRGRPDNLWGMGPLENLVGMQYRIDHVENVKADLLDLTAIPPLKITGYVNEFSWGPMSRIYVGDSGNVEMMIPKSDALQYNTEIEIYMNRMEEMAGAPKEAMGFRTPGEKTKYEVQVLENAASRIFQNKISALERDVFEPAYNAMLELARKNLDQISIRSFDSDEKLANFATITNADITGNGRIRATAARHFTETAQIVQNLTNFFNSSIGSDPEIKAHFSGVKLARLLENILDIDEYDLVEPFIRLSEQADAQRMMQVQQEQLAMEAQTPGGLAEDDFDPEVDDEVINGTA